MLVRRFEGNSNRHYGRSQWHGGFVGPPNERTASYVHCRDYIEHRQGSISVRIGTASLPQGSWYEHKRWAGRISMA